MASNSCTSRYSAPCESTREGDIHGGDESILCSFSQQTKNRRAAALAVVERQVVHVQPDERVGARPIEAAAILHGVRDGVSAMRQAERDAVVEQPRQP